MPTNKTNKQFKPTKMKATIKNPTDAINAKAHRKENAFMYEYAAIVKSKRGEMNSLKGFKVPVILRIYGTQSKNYCCLWAYGEVKKGGNHSEGKYLSANGSGSADGYGYHRPSAAAQEAINKAGFVLSESIDGRGDQAIESAVKAIAIAMGHKEKNIYIHKANA